MLLVFQIWVNLQFPGGPQCVWEAHEKTDMLHRFNTNSAILVCLQVWWSWPSIHNFVAHHYVNLCACWFCLHWWKPACSRGRWASWADPSAGRPLLTLGQSHKSSAWSQHLSAERPVRKRKHKHNRLTFGQLKREIVDSLNYTGWTYFVYRNWRY